MKRFVLVGALIVGGLAVFAIADTLSSDALGMALGMLFGICAGIPAALMVMAAQRGPASRESARQETRMSAPQTAQVPIILVAGGPQTFAGQSSGTPFWDLSDLQSQQFGRNNREMRQFRVIGEQDEGIDEW